MAKVLQYQAIAEPILVAAATAVTWGWWQQPSEPLRRPVPRARECYVEPLAPNSFIRQKLDWLVEQPGPTIYRKPKAGEYFVEPLVPIANVVVPSFAWFVQQPQATIPRRAKAAEFYVEPLIEIAAPPPLPNVCANFSNPTMQGPMFASPTMQGPQFSSPEMC